MYELVLTHQGTADESRVFKANAVYSHIDADPGSAEARNKITSDDNKRIIEQFKNGVGDDHLDVLINVRILSEGTDVPLVKSIFITRQTTSSILMTQMVGRGLRGPKAGGGPEKKEANIVMFVDNWKKLINWASAPAGGGTDDTRVVRGYYPLEYISIRLVEDLARQIDSGVVLAESPFLSFIPVGWYQIEITVGDTVEDFDQMQSFTEFVMVYERTKAKFEQFIQDASQGLESDWAKEYLSSEWMAPRVSRWIEQYFDPQQDNIGNTLGLDLIRIARHIAQNQVPPHWVAFEERERHDLDRVVADVLDRRLDAFAEDELLDSLFRTPGNLWKPWYKTVDRFKTAFDGAKRRALIRHKYGSLQITCSVPPKWEPPGELSEEEKEQVKRRDSLTCQACGAHGRGIRLEVDHIVPIKMGGQTDLDNSQTLCNICNRLKAINAINFRTTSTPLATPKTWEPLPRSDEEDITRSITRLINFFYHCKAVCQVHIHERKTGAFHHKWHIELFAGNNPEWLLQHKAVLLELIHKDFGYPHVKDIRITAAE
jgi:5-methylcytosine-specific restriction endonuclease McrA